MKLLACLLSFVILALTAIPCIDVSQDNTLQKIELSKDAAGNHHSDSDHCSPFCACNCCQSSVYFSSISATFSPVVLEIGYTEFSPAFKSIELFDFLRPPRF